MLHLLRPSAKLRRIQSAVAACCGSSCLLPASAASSGSRWGQLGANTCESATRFSQVCQACINCPAQAHTHRDREKNVCNKLQTLAAYWFVPCCMRQHRGASCLNGRIFVTCNCNYSQGIGYSSCACLRLFNMQIVSLTLILCNVVDHFAPPPPTTCLVVLVACNVAAEKHVEQALSSCKLATRATCNDNSNNSSTCHSRAR